MYPVLFLKQTGNENKVHLCNGRLLQTCGYRVTIQKFDPYINIDPGTLNPYEHGECYVTDDGMETDLDLGHYERFTGIHTTRNNSVTTGKIYQAVIEKERRGDYLGKTIQVVPHITNEIKDRFQQAGMRCSGRNPESDLVEIVEIPSLKWFIGTQFHPEYSSTVLTPHPLFVNFIKSL